MDNVQLLTSVEADGGFPARPRIRFNKDGALLAVSAIDNEVKILANSDGLRLLQTFENLSYDAAPRAPEAAKPTLNTIFAAARSARVASVCSIWGVIGDTRSMADVKPGITEEPNDKSKIWKLTEISESAHCRSLELPECMRATKISRLTYTNKGDAILILASNAVHLLWKWQCNERNSNGKATASISPQLWPQLSGILMINDAKYHDPEEFVACCALSKDYSYVVSASGRNISSFNMITFKKMTVSPPPRATFLAFYPQDNSIIAIGMDDSTILIYNVRMDEEKSRVKGHSKRLTGLAFSHVLNVLVSSGADALVCVWSSDGWERQKARYLRLPPERTPTAQSDT